MRIEESSEKVSRIFQSEGAYSFGGIYDDATGYYLLRQCGTCPTKYHAVGIKIDELWTLPTITTTIEKILRHENINFETKRIEFESKRKSVKEFLNGT